MSAQDRRAQLLTIGLDLLATRPIHDLALDEVAVGAGVSRTLVFHYFPSKGEYFAAMVDTLGERLLLDAPGDPAAEVGERLRAMVAGFLKFVRLHRGVYVTLVRGAAGGDVRVLEMLDLVRAQLVDLWLDAAEWPTRDPLTRLAVRGWLGALEEVALAVADSGVPRGAAVELLVSGLLDDLTRAATIAAPVAAQAKPETDGSDPMTDPPTVDFDGVDMSALLRPAPIDGEPGRFVLDVPGGLQQGRGAWGGVPTGAMVSAVQQVDPRPELRLRTMSAQLVAPLMVGRAHVIVESLRRGSGTHALAARILDDAGSLVAHSVVVLGAARPGPDMPDGPEWLAVDPPPELAAGPEAVPVLDVGPPLAPEFARALEFRIISGLPFTGRPDVVTLGWIRPRGPLADLGAPVVTALADAWWVVVVSALERPRPVGTLGFALELMADPASLPRDPDGRMRPLLHRGRSVSAAQGYLVETRELWSTDGRLVSWNTQTVAVIK